MKYNIRKGRTTDLESIDEIYNQAILQKGQTADIHPYSIKKRLAWFENHNDHYPIHVLEVDKKIIGWSSLSKYRQGRPALRTTAEVSYYLHQDHQGKGYGSILLEHAISTATVLGYNNLIALLLATNERSISLLHKYNFEEWGRVPDAAAIDGHRYDHLYLGRVIR